MSKIYDNIGDVAGRLLAISIKAKDFATEMTRVNVLQKDLNGMPSIEKEHIDYKCDALADVYCLSPEPPAIGQVFDRNDIRVHVPQASVVKYKSDKDWGKYENIPIKSYIRKNYKNGQNGRNGRHLVGR